MDPKILNCRCAANGSTTSQYGVIRGAVAPLAPAKNDV